MKPASIAAQGLGWVDDQTRALAPPIHTSTTFIRDPDNQYRSGRIYARDQNPTFDQAEAVLTALEGGHASLLFASGMAAATAVFQALSPGDHVLVPKVMYWSLRNWLTNFATQWGLRVRFIDMSNPDHVRSAAQSDKFKLVWIETPANPLWTITDIALTCEIAHASGATVAVDSTVATPVLTRPFELGADIVMHSATKYLNGHSDVIAGTLTAREDSALWLRIKSIRAQIGGVLGPFEAWLLTRGMRTLFPRVRVACASAQSIAVRLAQNRFVDEVLYPGLPSFPGHAIAARQMHGGFGGMLSIRVRGSKDGSVTGEDAAIATAAKVQLWKRATSLGGVESLIEHRASVEGAGTPVPGDLLRLSVGLEDTDDLVADLEQALAQAHSCVKHGAAYDTDRDQIQDEGDMTTKLEGPLKRALAIGGNPYVLTITPDGLALVPKGKRKGYSLAWNAFVGGEAALATALNASLMVAPAKSRAPEKRSPGKPSRKR